MSAPTFKTFDSKKQLTDLAVDIISARISEDINQSGTASLMVSGGSTPEPVYTQLSRTDLPWDKVKIGLVDDRWVRETDAGSNARFIHATLLQGFAKASTFVPMKTPHATPAQGQASVEALYQHIAQPYSALVLGMGTDGHTASWFPQSDGLEQALSSTDIVQAVTAKPSAVTGDYLERMTLTRDAVSRSKLALLLITGEQKRRVFEAALEPKSPPSSHAPIRAAVDALGERLIVLWAP